MGWQKRHWLGIGDRHSCDCRWNGRCLDMSTRRCKDEDTNATKSRQRSYSRTILQSSTREFEKVFIFFIFTIIESAIKACHILYLESESIQSPSQTTNLHFFSLNISQTPYSRNLRHIFCHDRAPSDLPNRRHRGLVPRRWTTGSLDKRAKRYYAGYVSNFVEIF
jgi:hypothetical protein